MATNHTAVALDRENASITTGASVAGNRVAAPARARLAVISSTLAIRVSLDAADGATLTDANSTLYPANASHDVWLRGVTPGGRNTSVHPDGAGFTVATASAGSVSVVYRS